MTIARMNSRVVIAAICLFATTQLLGAPTAPASPSLPPAAEKNQVPAETGYWLTIKSGIRHNSKCRYYKHSNGRPCTKDEGSACELCGG